MMQYANDKEIDAIEKSRVGDMATARPLDVLLSNITVLGPADQL